ncbi:11S globulin seed storage protein 2 [Dorcoceras hygrometricum]|uniref:11S globulin seed storage protein 2 n=1 Tax=Dorcoceras hygrometricum TaxID=472368 RepID=A0A2Z7A712_9LAMI|nr:11S globulin seed storage protein 2 [Dorcoceras hygrometricum]
MELSLVPQGADNILVEVDGAGTYYEWTPAKSPLLKAANLGAGKLVLHPRGFALPHYSNCPKIGYVIQGTCTVGMIQPNSPHEQVLIIRKGDAIPVPLGAISWWFNGGDTPVTVIFLGNTTLSYDPGHIEYFILSGPISLLAGFSSEFITKTYNITEDEAQKLTKSQTAPLIVKLDDQIAMPHQANIEKKGGLLYASLVDCKDISAENLPLLEEVGLSARLVRLEPVSLLRPSYSTDGSYRIFYAVSGSGKIQIVGLNGGLVLDGKVEEGELFAVPSFFAVSLIAGGEGIELFSINTSSRPNFGDLGGKLSPWKAMSSSVVQASLDVDLEFVNFFKSKLSIGRK